MNPQELLALLRQHWDDIRSALDQPQHELLVARLNALAAAEGDELATRKALQGVKLALLPLPVRHPVRMALASSTRLVATSDARPVATHARELLAWLADGDAPSVAMTVSDGPSDSDIDASAPDTAEIIATVQRRLLAAPALSSAELSARGVGERGVGERGGEPGPAGAGLIQLVDTAGEVRYPAFQFAGDGHGPLPVVERINRLLLAEQDPWGAADWWLAGNSWLGGTPAALLGLVSDELLTAAALALVEGD